MRRASDGGPLPKYLDTQYQANDLNGTLRHPSQFVQESIDGNNGPNLTGKEYDQLVDYTQLPKYHYVTKNGRHGVVHFEPWALFHLVPAMSASHQVQKRYAEVYIRYLNWFKTQYAADPKFDPDYAKKLKAERQAKAAQASRASEKAASLAMQKKMEAVFGGKPGEAKVSGVTSSAEPSVKRLSVKSSVVAKKSQSQRSDLVTKKPASQVAKLVKSRSVKSQVQSQSKLSKSVARLQRQSVSSSVSSQVSRVAKSPIQSQRPTSQVPRSKSVVVSSVSVKSESSSAVLSSVQVETPEMLSQGVADIVSAEPETGFDKYNLTKNLSLVPTTPIAGGDTRISYVLDNKNTSSVKVLPSIAFVARQSLLNDFTDKVSRKLIDNISYGDVLQSFVLIQMVRSQTLRRIDFRRYCLAMSITYSSSHQIEALRQEKSLQDVINGNTNQYYSMHLRWFLDLSRHDIGRTRNIESEISHQLSSLQDNNDLIRGMLAAFLTNYDPQDWDDMLYGDDTKRAMSAIDRAYSALVKPIQTRRRTRQVRNKLRRK